MTRTSAVQRDTIDVQTKCCVNGRDYRTGAPISLAILDGKIVKIQPLQTADVDSLPWLAPGLVDLQINGYNALDFNTLPISDGLVAEVARLLWTQGVTSFFPTIITNSNTAIEDGVSAIARACSDDGDAARSVAGIHLEGPFISPEDGPRGAHDRRFVRPPDWSLFSRWQEVANGMIKIITLSPEWPEAADFISRCVDSGVIVSIGHTAASPEQIQNAVAAGARMSTHLGNGAHLTLPRHPNYIWEQLAEDRLSACIIADGFHLPDSVLRVIIRVKGEQAILVSDAVYLTGMQPGRYYTHIGGEVVLAAEGKLHLAGNPKLLAGSVKTLIQDIEYMVQHGLSDLPDSLEMASIRPAKITGLPSTRGLNPDGPADLIVFNWNDGKIHLLQTYQRGEVVHDSRPDIF